MRTLLWIPALMLLLVGCADQVNFLVRNPVDVSLEGVPETELQTEPGDPIQNKPPVVLPPEDSNPPEDDPNPGDQTQNPPPPVDPNPVPDADNEYTDEWAMYDCGLAKKDKPQVFRVASKSVHLKFSMSRPVVVIATGNQANVKLAVSCSDRYKVAPSLCLISRGNKSSIRADVHVAVLHVRYRGRGNQTKGLVEVHAPGSIRSSVEVDLAGNQNRFEIRGSGSYPCPIARTAGDGNQVVCSE